MVTASWICSSTPTDQVLAGLQDPGRLGEEQWTGEQRFPCPVCRKYFPFHSILALHLRANPGLQAFQYPHCGHRAAQRALLSSHLRSHQQEHPLTPAAWLLLELEERTLLREDGRARSTGGMQPCQRGPGASFAFRCPFCKGKFYTSAERERHLQILHMPLKCSLCSFGSSQEEELLHLSLTATGLPRDPW